MGTTVKGMRIATRCATLEAFVAAFYRNVDEESFFIATKDSRPVGMETAFAIQLADGTAVLRGRCVVLQSWTTDANPFKHPGLRLGILHLTASSIAVFEKLLVTRKPSLRFSTTPADTTGETRTPGSDLILPANPLSEVSDAALAGYIDCTLYEETATYFATDEDPASALAVDAVAEPPLPANPLAPPLDAMADSTVTEAEPILSLLEPSPVELSLAVEPPRAPPPPPPPAPTFVAPSPPAPPPVPMRAMAAPTPIPTPTPAPLRIRAPRLRLRLPPWQATWLRQHRRVVVAGAASACALAVVIIIFASRPSQGNDHAAPIVAARVPPPEPAAAPPRETAPAPPATCTLSIAALPADSTVELDNQKVAGARSITTTCERHRVDVAHPRYQTRTEYVSPEPGKSATVEMHLARPTHHLAISSSPPGATITVNGAKVGVAPVVATVTGFEVANIRAEKPGYPAVTKKLYSKVPQDQLAISLTRAGGGPRSR